MAAKSDEPAARAAPPRRGVSPRSALHALTFLALLAVWTWKLLEPHPVPDDLAAGLARFELTFVAAKSLHAFGYAVLTVLAVTLPVSRPWRRFLVALLVCHGVGTEIGQTYVPNRTGRKEDVLIDWAGMAAAGLAVRWWRAAGPARQI